MITHDSTLQAEFFFKREPELDSDGNAVYALFSMGKDYSDGREYPNNIYVHIPEDEDIDSLYFNIENRSESDSLSFGLEKPLNLYFESTGGSSVVIDLSSKIEIVQDLKLYIKDFSCGSGCDKASIGFYDDEKTKASNCDNKFYCNSLVLEAVKNSSILFKRGNYNESSNSLKFFNWQLASDSNYKVGGAFRFVKMKNIRFSKLLSSSGEAPTILKLDNLSERRATSLDLKDITLSVDKDIGSEIEISAPSIALENIAINGNWMSKKESVALRDSHSITALGVTLNIQGIFNSKSQSGMFLRKSKNIKALDEFFTKGEVETNVKIGSLYFEGSNTIIHSKIDCEGSFTLKESKLVGATIAINDLKDEIVIEESRIRNTKIEGLLSSEGSKNSSKYDELFEPYMGEKVIKYCNIENIDLIRATIKYNDEIKNPDDYVLELRGNIAVNGLRVEDSIFNISKDKPTQIVCEYLADKTPNEKWLIEKEKEPAIIKSCSFYGKNKLTCYGPVDFSNTIFQDSEVVTKYIHSIHNSEVNGNNTLTLIEEPIFNAVLVDVDLNNVSGISDNYISNFQAKDMKYNTEVGKIGQSVVDSHVTEELEKL